MSDNSDTESELGESHYGPDMKVEQGPNEPAPCEQVRDAIEKLMLLDLSSAIKVNLAPFFRQKSCLIRTRTTTSFVGLRLTHHGILFGF